MSTLQTSKRLRSPPILGSGFLGMQTTIKYTIIVIVSLLSTAIILSLVEGVLCAEDNSGSNSQGKDGQLQRLSDCEIIKQYQGLSSFAFNPRSVSREDSACLSLKMFKEMGFVRFFSIPEETLFRGYRDLPYHNWHHAFAVLHFSFAVLTNCRLIEKQHFTPLEGLALLTAALCHDIDHRGTNNQFQLETNSTLAQRYRDQGSIMERHHIAITFSLLENSDTNFLAHFDGHKLNHFKHLIRQIILATDLAVHFKLLPEEKQMAEAGFDRFNSRHKELLRSVIISCADLSDQSKDWATVRAVAKLVYTEFFAQGDQEKRLGQKPITMMDRSQAKLPQLQVDFLSHVVIPDFLVLLSIYPETQGCMDNMQQNLVKWKKATPYFESQTLLGRDQLDILSDKELNNISLWPQM
ncbi:cGMP-dependent 3',5'-cyclic phosphodiesterase-like isoform X2 [Homalodisca vitripennis]|uniref:cGMP-dependent 3',5'-cyclic phosphodiesterase-like isoform X2 n=1 Tax=Homalodisca vitripennis TaxID=197043 RepID=UPI001EEA0BB2|nr:cGMP-dependent 3',5'-cyclic phosphodiesterase-like isoform X2 [Homalodisca vitripennis]